jgi:hypothetical protein
MSTRSATSAKKDPEIGNFQYFFGWAKILKLLLWDIFLMLHTTRHVRAKFQSL